jgi:hypothetical protein
LAGLAQAQSQAEAINRLQGAGIDARLAAALVGQLGGAAEFEGGAEQARTNFLLQALATAGGVAAGGGGK